MLFQCRMVPSIFNVFRIHMCFHQSAPSFLCHMRHTSMFSNVGSKSSILQSTAASIIPLVMQTCGMKQKTVLKLRCKHCFFVQRRGQWFVDCKEKPRHKQKQIMNLQKITPHFRDIKYLEGPHLRQFRVWKKIPF